MSSSWVAVWRSHPHTTGTAKTALENSHFCKELGTDLCLLSTMRFLQLNAHPEYCATRALAMEAFEMGALAMGALSRRKVDLPGKSLSAEFLKMAMLALKVVRVQGLRLSE